MTLDEVLARKRLSEQSVTVILPALDEGTTVGRIVSTLHPLMAETDLIDELVVVDSGSTDDTVDVARRAGAAVIRASDVLPHLGSVGGKGEALWKGLAATTGDLVVFIDADLETVCTDYVTGLLGPLLADPSITFVKSFSDRPFTEQGTTVLPSGGGRVTELVARPLLNLYWPHLSGIIGPLTGEYAGRRRVLESVPFASGYGVEIAMLIDIAAAFGVDSIAQVDLGQRVHQHQPDGALARMSAHVIQAAVDRLRGASGLDGVDSSGTLVQFHRQGSDFVPAVYDVSLTERPPVNTVPEIHLQGARRLLAAEVGSSDRPESRPIAG